jgi:hypothetical protein
VLNDLVRRYRWADEELDLAWTVAVIEGQPMAEVVRRDGGDPDQSIGDHTFAQLDDLQGDADDLRFHLQTFVHKRHVVAVERNGWTGAVPEIARRCARDNAEFFAVHWSLSSNPRIDQAVDGRVAAYFEMFAGATPHAGGPVPGWMGGLVVELDRLRSTAMALLEWHTGLAFERQWLDEVTASPIPACCAGRARRLGAVISCRPARRGPWSGR